MYAAPKPPKFILFKDDWRWFPTAVVDYSTTNQSFLKLVAVYKAMGVENCEFPLALLQPELIGVDPHSENLTIDQMKMIAQECKYNPWYYFREVARVPPNSGSVPARFRADRGNIAMYWSFFNHIDFCLLQPRQTGKSVGSDSLANGIVHVWAYGTEISLITKDSKLRTKNVERLKEMAALLPEYINVKMKDDLDNSEVLTCRRLKNIYKTAVARNDKQAADKLGRGQTSPILIVDEMPYCSMIRYSLPVALSSATAARDEARELNQLYGNIFTTTPGSTTTEDGKYAYEFMTGGAMWDERYLDAANQAELEDIITKAARGRKVMIYGAFTHRQLGRSDEWLYKTLIETNSYGELADRDYLMIWTAGTEGSPFSSDIKQQITGSMRDPIIELYPGSYTLRWNIPRNQIDARMATSHYILGCDPSDALGSDNDSTSFYLLDIETHDTVCAGNFNETNLHSFGEFVANFLLRYKNVTLNMERRSSGTALMDIIIAILVANGEDPFRRIFNRVVDEHTLLVTEYRTIMSTPPSQRNMAFYAPFKRFFGFATGAGGRYSRDSLYVDTLKSFMRYGTSKVYDKMLINELMGLTIKNGRLDHSSGNHDDLVIGMLLAHWVCAWGQNLSYYGIDPKRIFVNALQDMAGMSPIELQKHQRDEALRDELQELMQQMRMCKTPYEAKALELRIRRISEQVELTDGEGNGLGVDSLINKLNEERKNRSNMARMSYQRYRY